MARNGLDIVGSVKVTKWDKGIVLPIQKLFNVDPEFFETRGKSIWHVGRFAISSRAKDGAKLLRKLIAIAIYPICCAEDSIMLAECDGKFVKALNLMGVKTKILGDGIVYLGSETFPVCSTKNWLLQYLSRSPYYKDAMDFYCAYDPSKYPVQDHIKTIEPKINIPDIITLNEPNDTILRAI